MSEHEGWYRQVHALLAGVPTVYDGRDPEQAREFRFRHLFKQQLIATVELLYQNEFSIKSMDMACAMLRKFFDELPAEYRSKKQREELKHGRQSAER